MTTNRQNEPWLANVKAALDAMGASKMDSAEYFAKRSMLMTSANPYAHYVLANAANTKGDKPTAVLHWNHVVDRAGTDSNYADLKANSQYYAAMSTLEIANEKSGAEQADLARKAAAAMKAILTATPNHPDAVMLLNGQVDALTLVKDTAAIPGVYADVLAKPDAASEYVLLNAGVIASRANRGADAEKLFEATLTKNPNSRDALFNLAGRYQGTNQHAKLLQKARTLLTIEPNNQDVYMLIAYAAQETRNATKVAAEKALWLDTLKTYQTAAEKLPVKVDITGFSTAAASATLKLSLEPTLPAGGTYSVTVEFIDREGKVVATQTESSGPIKQGEKKEVSLKGEGAGIVGYRYKPVK
jgi:tetratricopeptide (TPR) repeat protein